MASGLSSWNDSVGVKFNKAVSNTNNYLTNGIKPVQEKIDSAREIANKPVVVKSQMSEIKRLEVY